MTITYKTSHAASLYTCPSHLLRVCTVCFCNKNIFAPFYVALFQQHFFSLGYCLKISESVFSSILVFIVVTLLGPQVGTTVIQSLLPQSLHASFQKSG